MLNVPVPQIVLNEAGVRPLVGKSKATGVAQHVGRNGHRELGLPVVFAQGEVDSRAVQGLALLTEEEQQRDAAGETPMTAARRSITVRQQSSF